ncbi:MAG: hypothetical protein IKM73_07750 [Acidaminococcaceae bacterium]|nr:hypothetical protein [Acidaminococcaceae bacterium]
MEWQITDFLSREEILCQVAEEASELSQAALKLKRAIEGVNPTNVGLQQAVKNFNEEIADVRLCLDQLRCVHEDDIEKIYRDKEVRWLSRLIAARREEDERLEALRKQGYSDEDFEED